MRFKSEKGITGIDLVVAITIILIAIGTITTVYVNINKTYRSTNRNSVAGKIATDIMAAIDVSYFFEIETTIDAMGNDNPVVVDGGSDISNLIRLLGSGANNLKIPNGYRVEVSVVEAEEPTIAVKELLKKIDIEISYLVSGEREFVEFTKYKGRYGLSIPERPLQQFDDLENFDYTPIKYNKLSERWEKTFFADTTWYEYRENYWPIMVRTKKGVEPLIDGKVVKAADVEVFVWVPQISNVPSKGFSITTTVEELTTGGLTDQKVYTYMQNEKDNTNDYTIPEDRRVSFLYDELDYRNPQSINDIVIEKGWYKFTKGSAGLTMQSLNGSYIALVNNFFEYDDGDIIDSLKINQDIYIYSNKDIILEKISNFPKIN